MANESQSSHTNNHSSKVNIDNVGDILESIIAGRDVNIFLVIQDLKAQTSVGDRIGEVRKQWAELYNATMQLLSRSMSELSSQYPTLWPGELEQRLEDSLRLTRQSRQLSRAKGLLGEFIAVSPQAMMITEPITFVFGGETGEAQPAIHIAKALREKRIRVNFRGLDLYNRIGAVVERDPSFPSGPLKVILPAGTCIYPEGGMEFSSFKLPRQEAEAGRVVCID